jgi:hypothetical protein
MKISLVKLWPVVLLLLLVAACGKEKSIEEDSSQFFIKCKIDGVDKTFNYSAAAGKQDLGDGSTAYVISGYTDAGRTENLGFTFTVFIPLSTGTYKVTDPTTDYTLGCGYIPNLNNQTDIYFSDTDEANPFQVTFTNITSSVLTGTFTGKLVNVSNPISDSAIITAGSFKVKIQ